MKASWLLTAIALIASPAYAQTTKPMPQYGDINGRESPSEIETRKRDDAAYKKSLGNIPDAKPADPWGGVRADTKPISKPAAAKSLKPSPPAK